MYRFIRHASSAGLAALVIFVAPAGAQQLSYGLPSPATATYLLVDSTNMSIEGPPMGEVSFGGSASFTFNLTFAAAGDAVRVNAELSDFEGRMSDPMGGMTNLSQALAGVSDFEVLLGPRGLAEVTDPSRALNSELPMLVDAHVVAFPALPDGAAAAGQTWVDTVAVRIGDGVERTIVYTYTLEGEVAHNGRPHLRVAVSGQSSMAMDDEMNLAGTETGHFLWDVERGLVSSSEMSRRSEGTMDSPQASLKFVMTATTRLSLEN